MADAAVARREARMRKILANSHNRLQIISGKNGNEFCKELPIKTPIAEQSFENSVQTESSSSSDKCFLNGIINVEMGPPFNMPTNIENFAVGDGNVTVPNHDLAAFLNPIPACESRQTSTSLIEKITNSKYDIVILSLLIQLFYSIYITFEETYIMLPLFIYCVTKSVLYPKQQNSQIANILFLLNGISATKFQKLFTIIQWLSTFFQDVCVFLFTTVCTQSLWQQLRNNMV